MDVRLLHPYIQTVRCTCVPSCCQVFVMHVVELTSPNSCASHVGFPHDKLSGKRVIYSSEA